MTLSKQVILLCFAVSVLALVETRAEFHLETGAICVRVEQPGSCMESYGFKCHRVELPSKSFGAYAVGCNLHLPDGRHHFVQMLNKNGEWNIEADRTSDPDRIVRTRTPRASELALEAYVRDEMASYRVTGTGGANIEGTTTSLLFESGSRMVGEEVTIRSVCGVIFEGELSENLATQAKAECQKSLLRDIMIRSQFTTDSPYRAAGANETTWKSTTLSLAPDALTLVLDGRHTFTPEPGVFPCRFQPNCCSKEGVRYLDSCRVPTEEEMQAIKFCLNQGAGYRTDEYFDCLSDAKVKTGCDDQADGSRLCY